MVAVFGLTACSDAQTTMPAADVKGAAVAAQGDIDTYAANTLSAVPRAAPVARVSPPAPTRSSIADEDVSPQQLARSYYTLLAGREYDRAYRLWDDGGAASGLSRRAFADSFAGYATYRAEVGTPGRIEAGAGQRYVEVPVRIRTTPAAGGRPAVLTGSLTLHRTADIDGATPEQRSWRISAASLRPRADPAAVRCPATRVSERNEAPDAGVWQQRAEAPPPGCPTAE